MSCLKYIFFLEFHLGSKTKKRVMEPTAQWPDSDCPMGPITMVLCSQKISYATKEKLDPPDIVPVTAVHLEGRVHIKRV